MLTKSIPGQLITESNADCITTETCNLKNNIFGNKLKTKWISYYTTNIIQT